MTHKAVNMRDEIEKAGRADFAAGVKREREKGDGRRIGFSWVVPPSPHAGHTVTVEKRDAVDKHMAFWLVCECGTRSLIGEYWLDRLIDGTDKPSYKFGDERW